MTDWTARIDALLAEPIPTCSTHGSFLQVANARMHYYERRLALAAERLREPHTDDCGIWYGVDTTPGHPDNPWGQTETEYVCTCGKDSDLLRILEGK